MEDKVAVPLVDTTLSWRAKSADSACKPQLYCEVLDVVVVDLVLHRFTEVVPTMLGGTFVSGVSARLLVVWGRWMAAVVVGWQA